MILHSVYRYHFILWRPLVGASGSSWCVEVSRGLSLGCLGGFGSLPHPCRRLHVTGPRSVIFCTFLIRARPSLQHAPWLPLLQSILQRRFRSTVGAAIPLSSLFLSLSLSLSLRFASPGVRLRSVPVRPSVRPTLP